MSYFATPTASVEAVQESVSEVVVTALEARPEGTEGAVVSGAARVLTESALDASETLPAASRALTVKL